MSIIEQLKKELSDSPEQRKQFLEVMVDVLDLRKNIFHPLVFVNGSPEIGENVYVGLFSELNAKGGTLRIGNNCDVASFVSINVADSHLAVIGNAETIERGKIVLEDNVFVGSHCFIGGNVHIGHHSVVGAGTILTNAGYIPPYSLIIGNPAVIKSGYYASSTQ